MLRTILTASILLTVAGAAQAEVLMPIADLTDGVARQGNYVSGEDNVYAPATWQVYTIQANAGDNILIRVSRLTANVDPVAAAHLGDATGLDALGGLDYIDDLSYFGLELVAFGDDNVDDAFGGPFGDPLFGFEAPETGVYTVITHMYGDYPGNPGYEIQVTGSTVPAPGAAALAGIGGLLCVRRRRAR